MSRLANCANWFGLLRSVDIIDRKLCMSSVESVTVFESSSYIGVSSSSSASAILSDKEDELAKGEAEATHIVDRPEKCGSASNLQAIRSALRTTESITPYA